MEEYWLVESRPEPVCKSLRVDAQKYLGLRLRLDQRWLISDRRQHTLHSVQRGVWDRPVRQWPLWVLQRRVHWTDRSRTMQQPGTNILDGEYTPSLSG